MLSYALMKTQKHKNLIALILLIFIGQVFSAPMLSCSQNQEMESSTMMMDIDMDMHMDSMNSSEMDTMNMDCCGNQCDCPDAMCISHVFIATVNDLSTFQVPKPYLATKQNLFVQKHLVSAIFHPPILS